MSDKFQVCMQLEWVTEKLVLTYTQQSLETTINVHTAKLGNNNNKTNKLTNIPTNKNTETNKDIRILYHTLADTTHRFPLLNSIEGCTSLS